MLPQKNTSVKNNRLQFHTIDLKKDGAQLLLSKKCIVTQVKQKYIFMYF